MPKSEFRNGARLAAAAGLGLTLALGAVPAVALAEGTASTQVGTAAATERADEEHAEVPDEAYPVYIGEQGYGSFSEAMKEAKAGDTVRLEADTTSSAVWIRNNLTIDLNGHKLDLANNVTITVTIDSSLTIEDSSSLGSGTISGSNGPGVINCVGTLNLQSGSIVNSDMSSGSQGAVIVNGSDAKFTVTGGSVEAEKNAVLARDGGVVEISGGEILSKAD